MSENKVPTDGDILKEYYSEGSNGGDYISNLTESDTLLWLIKKARAAGREEQRERDIEIVNRELKREDFQRWRTFITEAIRAQGEGEK